LAAPYPSKEDLDKWILMAEVWRAIFIKCPLGDGIKSYKPISRILSWAIIYLSR